MKLYAAEAVKFSHQAEGYYFFHVADKVVSLLFTRDGVILTAISVIVVLDVMAVVCVNILLLWFLPYRVVL
ncbi:MAG: hypothetical protein LBI79_05230 [Nitrososphaerota archaeon]|jgi:hypothetical protein|nr:hypothetical protein [Nitrososphaerota archaeon]